MKTFRFTLACLFCLFFLFEGVFAQSCYVRLADDASGYTPTANQIAELEQAAADLCAAFDSAGFGGQFKVYDFGFYLHQEVTEGGYPEPFAQKMEEVGALSPYYLLFGKQTDRSGIYTRFWVDLKLPDTGKFGCIDLLSSTLRSEIRIKVEYIIANTFKNSGYSYQYYDMAEKSGMGALREIIVKYTECCDLQPKGMSACESFVLPAQLSEVTYSGDAYIEMRQDDNKNNNENFGQPFPKPHYVNTRLDNEQSPLAHVSGRNVSALAKFNGNEMYESIMVRGAGESQVSGVMIKINFDEQTASQDEYTKQITANMTGGLPYMAVFLDDFRIKWEMKVKKTGEPEGDWEPVGESINDWYLTLRKPKPEGTGTGYAHYQTLFDIGCKYGKGTSDSELLIGVWNHFKNKEVNRSDGERLAYYKTWFLDPPPSTAWVYTDELLKNKEGQCNAWAKFFLDILKAQGCLEDGFLLIVKPDPTNQNRPSGGFILGNWDFKTGISIGEKDFDYWNIYNNENKYAQSPNGQWGHVWWQNSNIPLPQVVQESCVSAQGNPNNSLSYFGQHVIVKIKSDGVEKYFDPSYGLEYDNIDKIDDNVAGFWFELMDYTLPEFITPAPTNGYDDLVLFRKNGAQERLKIDVQFQY